MNLINYKVIILASLILVSFISFSRADPVIVSYKSTKELHFDPVSDDRVIGYMIYFQKSGGEGYRKRLDGRENSSWAIPAGILHPSSNYVFTATSFDAYDNQSERSLPLEVQVQGVNTGDLTDYLPEPWQSIMVVNPIITE